MSEKKQVLIVDDHPLLRRGLAMLIDMEPDMEVCGETEDVTGGMEAAERTGPDIVLVDITLKDSDGVQLIRMLKARCPAVPVLAISMHDESVYAERALRAGARGYLTKQTEEDEIIRAVRRVLEGGTYLSETTRTRTAIRIASENNDPPPSPAEVLSDRELEVFRLIGRGLRARRIATKLGLSVKTVETYQAQIKNKLCFASAGELTEFAVAWMKSIEP